LTSLEAQLAELQAAGKQSEAAELVVKLTTENAKRERWAVSEQLSHVWCEITLWLLLVQKLQFENSLRRHNHVGLMHALLVALAKAGKLEAAKENARNIMKERIEKRKEKGDADMDDEWIDSNNRRKFSMWALFCGHWCGVLTSVASLVITQCSH
jgi:ubiquitin carboxyl-terminal hydrolase L5